MYADDESHERLRKTYFEVIDNQIKLNDPPEVKQTFDRLLKLGYNKFETKSFIADCLQIELFEVIKNDKKFDEKRYVRNLKNLPQEPI